MPKKLIFAGFAAILASFGAGFAAGYFYMKKKFFKEYEIVEDAIVPLETTEVVVEKQEKQEETVEKAAKEDEKKPKNDYKKALVDYAKMSNSKLKRNPAIEEGMDVDTTDDYLEPYVISKYDYDHEKLHYSKVSVWYYTDNVMVEEGRESDPEYDGRRYLGMDVNDIFGMIDDPDNDNPTEIAYVRNDRLGIDYEVQRSSQSFHEEE